MSQLSYNGATHLWWGENETMYVRMSDATLRKHFHAHLAELGLPTQSYSEMQAELQRAFEQQFEVWQQFLTLERWESCQDPDVFISRVRLPRSR